MLSPHVNAISLSMVSTVTHILTHQPRPRTAASFYSLILLFRLENYVRRQRNSSGSSQGRERKVGAKWAQDRIISSHVCRRQGRSSFSQDFRR
ncbi:hypothetical protein M413DRAFT_250055 [Hebeloma cylindrosporum]|uniref:Uncharacterized protein n=1 Tax=Hebeloma cylindrosporum TaxID=76867 RepID=A0A0C2YAI4_HEBCY|nr:hypothetical protein M413DRAFT_250055 [Hebeloma cylindrosporum h7]